MDVKIENSWKNALKDEFSKEYFKNLVDFVKEEYRGKTPIYPQGSSIFKAFELTPLEKVKVVLLGQDPYHGEGQAHGLSFSVNEGVKIPPSLRNIYKEIEDDLAIKTPASGNLTRWAKQGVLLLNATLTVRAHQPGSHQNRGWEIFTDAVIQALSEQRENLVFLLWGAYAKEKGACIDKKKHFVLTAAHPSPFSAYRGFFGCKHFSKTNDFLTARGLEPIHW